MSSKKEKGDLGGLSEFGADVLGFLEMCRCGHDYGLHSGEPGAECAVLGCRCGRFRPLKPIKPGEDSA